MPLSHTLSLLLLATPFLVAAQKADDTLLWARSRPLTWHDFRGMPERDPLVGARTYATIRYRLFHNRDTFYTEVTCAFLKRVSWKVTSKTSDYALNHEQRHFDIAQVYAQKLRAEFAALPFRRRSLSSDVAAIFNRVCAEKDSLDACYDRETLLSLDKEKQEAWNRKIDQLLLYTEALERYRQAMK